MYQEQYAIAIDRLCSSQMIMMTTYSIVLHDRLSDEVVYAIANVLEVLIFLCFIKQQSVLSHQLCPRMQVVQHRSYYVSCAFKKI